MFLKVDVQKYAKLYKITSKLQGTKKVKTPDEKFTFLAFQIPFYVYFKKKLALGLDNKIFLD